MMSVTPANQQLMLLNQITRNGLGAVPEPARPLSWPEILLLVLGAGVGAYAAYRMSDGEKGWLVGGGALGGMVGYLLGKAITAASAGGTPAVMQGLLSALQQNQEAADDADEEEFYYIDA